MFLKWSCYVVQSSIRVVLTNLVNQTSSRIAWQCPVNDLILTPT